MHCMKDSAFVMKINLSEYFFTIEIGISLIVAMKAVKPFFPQFLDPGFQY